MFKYHADFNINNLINGYKVDLGKMAGKGKKKSKMEKIPTYDHSYGTKKDHALQTRMKEMNVKRDKEDIKLFDIELRKVGFKALAGMKVPWVKPTTTADEMPIFSMAQTKNIITKTKAAFLKVDAGGTDNLPMQRAFLQFDEAHLIVRIGKQVDDQLDYQELLKELFRHREGIPLHLWPRVVLHTATPVANSPLDPIRLLNLLVDKDSAWLDFMYDKNTNIELNRFEMHKKFFRRYVRPNGELNNAGKAKWNKLAAGRISALNLYGDRSHFAQVDMHIEPVRLSELQTKTILCCLEYNPAVNCSQTKQNKNEEGETKTNKTKKTKTQNADSDAYGEETDPMLQKALTTLLSPQLTTKMNKDPLRKRAAKYAPNVKQLIDELATRDAIDKTEYAAVRAEHRRRGESVTNMPSAAKIFLYVTATKPAASTMILALLESRGYKPLNRVSGGGMKLDLTIKPYKAYINYTVCMTSTFQTDHPPWTDYNNQNWSTALRAIYNHPNNDDGEHCLIFVLSAKEREGISLKNVRKTYVAGAELTSSNLIQGISRAVRYCSSQQLPWDPVKGWVMNVYMQSFLWHEAVRVDPEALQKLEASFGEMLRAVNPHGAQYYKCMEYMDRLMSKSAVDRPLFGKLNDRNVGVIKAP
jgi:hypothetical protein